MPWISDDIIEWDELPEAEQADLRALLEDLGLECPDEDDDYYE